MSTKTLSTYSGLVSGGNWTPALQAAYDALATNGGLLKGGKMLFDVDAVKIASQTTFTTLDGYQVNMTLEGDPGVEVWVACGSDESAFRVGDKGKFVVRDMNFKGDGATGAGASPDCDKCFSLANCLWAFFEKCSFAGIFAWNPVNEVSNVIEAISGTNLVVRDSNFGGCAGVCINADGAYSLLVENCDFLDYFILNGVNHDKTQKLPYWIRAINPPTGVGANRERVTIINNRFDEGGNPAVFVDGYEKVDVSYNRFNITALGGAAIHLKSTKNNILKQNHVGYNTGDRPLVKLEHCDSTVIVGLGKDDEENKPYRIETDAYSAAGLKIFDSPGVSVAIV